MPMRFSCASRARTPMVSDESPFFFAASGKFCRIMENRMQREDGCVTQILVARAPTSPQFYCAYRSIQTARISPRARLEILRDSAFTSRRPPASLATTLLSPSLGATATWSLLLVPRPPSVSLPASSNSIVGQVSRRFFSSIPPGMRELETNFRRLDDLTSMVPAACLQRDVTRDKSRAYSTFKQ